MGEKRIKTKVWARIIVCAQLRVKYFEIAYFSCTNH